MKQDIIKLLNQRLAIIKMQRYKVNIYDIDDMERTCEVLLDGIKKLNNINDIKKFAYTNINRLKKVYVKNPSGQALFERIINNL
jgi:hypothetical protein